jgi:adenosine kinase
MSSTTQLKKAYVFGSLAYDNLLAIKGRFSDCETISTSNWKNSSFLLETVTHAYGGCAGNIAYALKTIGIHPLIISCLGRDSEAYLSYLRRNQIDTDLINTDDTLMSAQCTILTDLEQNQITTFYSGPKLQNFKCLANSAVKLAIITPCDVQAMLAQIDVFQRAGTFVIFDPGQQISRFSVIELQRAIAATSLLVVNVAELNQLIHTLSLDIAELSLAVNAIVITHGEKGCEVRHGGVRYMVDAARPSKVVDPTGCGDAFRGGLIYGLVHSWSLVKSAALGNYLGSLKVAHAGAQGYEIDLVLMNQFIKQCAY